MDWYFGVVLPTVSTRTCSSIAYVQTPCVYRNRHWRSPFFAGSVHTDVHGFKNIQPERQQSCRLFQSLCKTNKDINRRLKIPLDLVGT